MLRNEIRDRLELLGRERALIYKTLVLTGLRKGELESLTAGSLYLDGATAFAQLDAADEKNREGNAVPIRDDLADDLRVWLADKLARFQAVALDAGQPVPARLPANTPVFDVPEKTVQDSQPRLGCSRHRPKGKGCRQVGYRQAGRTRPDD